MVYSHHGVSHTHTVLDSVSKSPNQDKGLTAEHAENPFHYKSVSRKHKSSSACLFTAILLVLVDILIGV